MVIHSGHACVSQMLLVVNFCPAILESTAPHSHLFIIIIIIIIIVVIIIIIIIIIITTCALCTFTKDDEILPVQEPSHA
jgi:threonine/homoserine/homoserine lactone efflux protein